MKKEEMKKWILDRVLWADYALYMECKRLDEEFVEATLNGAIYLATTEGWLGIPKDEAADRFVYSMAKRLADERLLASGMDLLNVADTLTASDDFLTGNQAFITVEEYCVKVEYYAEDIRRLAAQKGIRNTYRAFLSAECGETGLSDIEIIARNKEEARAELKRRFESIGLKAGRSITSDDVTVTMADGTEAVYYGFDEN